MELVKYVQGLGWTQEQLVVLATAALVCVLGIALIRALKRALVRDQVSELRAQVESLHRYVQALLGRLEELEGDSYDDAEWEAVTRCLRVLETGLPQHDSECARAAMLVLLQHAATHPDRNQEVWRPLMAKIDRLVTDVVDGSASDPETTRLIGLRVREILTDAVASKSEAPALVAAAERVFRGVLAKTEEDLLQNPTTAMTTAMEVALKDMMQPWLDDEDDDDIKQAAIRVFMAVVKLVETLLSTDPGELSTEFDSAVIKRVKGLIGSDDDELNEDIAQLAEKVVGTRGSALLRNAAASFAEVDGTLVSKVASYVEDNDLDEPVEKLARAMVDIRVAALTTQPPEALVAKVEEQVTSDVESWLDDNPDEVAPAVERLAKAVLDKEAKALMDAPPDGVVATVREKITDAIDEQLDELTEEISSAARDVAKAAIAQSTQAS